MTERTDPNAVVTPTHYETDPETGCRVCVFASGTRLYEWGSEEWRYIAPTPANRRQLAVKIQAQENERHYRRYPTPKAEKVPVMATASVGSAGAEGAK